MTNLLVPISNVGSKLLYNTGWFLFVLFIYEQLTDSEVNEDTLCAFSFPEFTYKYVVAS